MKYICTSHHFVDVVAATALALRIRVSVRAHTYKSQFDQCIKNAYIKNRNLFAAVVVVVVWIGRRRESCRFFRFVCQWTWRCLSIHSHSRGHFAYTTIYRTFRRFTWFCTAIRKSIYTQSTTTLRSKKKNDQIIEMKIQKYMSNSAMSIKQKQQPFFLAFT